MEADSAKPVATAWQPLTPRGVAAFAGARLGRLLLVQGVVALLAAGAVIWFLATAWFPVIGQAIRQLPAQGEIRAGWLDTPREEPLMLAEGRFLALALDLQHQGNTRSPAHIQVEFGKHDLRFLSLLGFVRVGYPRGTFPANQPQLEPWWGAWSPVVLALAGGAVAVGLMVVWTLLALAYWVPAWLLGYFADRQVGWGGSWRLAGASLLPGALWMIVSIVGYGLGLLDQVQWLAAAAAHVVIGWIYLVLSPWALPRRGNAGTRGNPFQPAESAGEQSGSR